MSEQTESNRATAKYCKVHVQPPIDWKSQYWMVARDDGGLFCSCLFALVPEGGETRERAELIAAAVNEYLERHKLLEQT